IAVGEHTGALDTMLAKIADFYEDEVDEATQNLLALLEPVIIAFLGVVIGGIVVSMYLPMFALISKIACGKALAPPPEREVRPLVDDHEGRGHRDSHDLRLRDRALLRSLRVPVPLLRAVRGHVRPRPGLRARLSPDAGQRVVPGGPDPGGSGGRHGVRVPDGRRREPDVLPLL